MEKALIAMSGGVDSSVAADLLLRSGYECVGTTMRLCSCDLVPGSHNDPAADAKAVADRLCLPFSVLEATEVFEEQVVRSFIHDYENGITPNPCIRCNKKIKFDVLLDYALSLGCQWLATGHYAQIRYNQDTGRYLLCKAADKSKDQTYFLAGLDQHQLSHTKLPLGELTKEQVRRIAQERGFLNARKRDSQDICFIPDGDFAAFIRRYTGTEYPQGDFLDLQGNVVGKHNGAFAYTLGQRKGLGIALGEPVYVCSKDMEKNTVTVGPNEALFHKTVIATDWNWLPFPSLTEPMRVTAKARYRHAEQPATVYPDGRVEFDELQRAMTPGQAVVLYDGDTVVGSGTITQVL